MNAREFSEKVKALRVRLGGSQYLFAEAVGVKLLTLQSWEAGRFVPDYPHVVLVGLREIVKDVLAKKGKLPRRRNQGGRRSKP